MARGPGPWAKPYTYKPASRGPVTFAEASKLRPDMLHIGMKLSYGGDSIPYVEAKHLTAKGREKGSYLLPAKNVDTDAWVDIPGSIHDTYTIVDYETNRRSKKGVKLADIYWIVGSGYEKQFRFGLNPLDVCEKFTLAKSSVSDIESEIDEVIHDGTSALEQKLIWQRSVQETGW